MTGGIYLIGLNKGNVSPLPGLFFIGMVSCQGIAPPERVAGRLLGHMADRIRKRRDVAPAGAVSCAWFFYQGIAPPERRVGNLQHALGIENEMWE